MVEEGMSSIRGNAQQRQAVVQQMLSSVDLSTKDADTAFLIELIGGIFGLYGLGYLYAGLQNTGIFRLVGGLVAIFLVWTLFTACVVPLTLGFGLCLAPVLLLPQWAAAYFSANDLKLALNAAKAGGRGMSNMGGTTGTGSNFGGYIESPTSTGSSGSLFNEPASSERPYTPASSPDINLGGSSSTSSTSGTSAAGLYETPSDDSSDEDFDPNDLTKKV